MLIPQNEWSFVAITYDQANVTVWLNGESAPNAMTDFDTPDSHLFIGAETINNGGSFRSRFNGLIDEFAIFDVALTESELMSIMDRGLEANIAAVSPLGKLASTWGQIKK